MAALIRGVLRGRITATITTFQKTASITGRHRCLHNVPNKLNTLLEKVKASGFSSMEGIDHIVNGINLRRRDVVLLKTTQTWVLLATVIAGCAFGSGWTHAPRKHLVKEEKM